MTWNASVSILATVGVIFEISTTLGGVLDGTGYMKVDRC